MVARREHSRRARSVPIAPTLGCGCDTTTLTTLLLSDFGPGPRQRLLFVSSGGISRVVQNTFPARPRISSAMVVHLPAGTLGRPHVVLIKLKYPERWRS